MMESQATLITDDDDQPDTMRATINRGELLHELRHLCRTADTRQFAPPICACVQYGGDGWRGPLDDHRPP